ncbi:MAG: asparagine synthase (glutamine-hydrolyzing) [Lachnospiraceae bacterium]|nr:asparagine synthase (glutamine-hydrolyzing) [Lachnospiraceae bacterium]
MCGITGILNYKDKPIENITTMNMRNINRGPDAGGHWLDSNAKVVLGHRRLSVVDLSEAGMQPLASHSGKLMIVYNGEIYNAEDIRAELEAESDQIVWNGHSDTEVLVEAVEKWGLKETLRKCKGMWGLAVYDRETKRVQLARDRIGKKPLYYGRVNGQFAFASSIASVAAVEGFNNPVNRDVIDAYLQYGYIPSPYSIYKDVFKLEPGSILTIDAPYDTWTVEQYFDITELAVKGQDRFFTGSEEEATVELERLLTNAVKGQMSLDVPFGAFLSGGIDSSLVVSLMQNISDKPVKTYTIGFDDAVYNEARFAAQTAKHLGTDHRDLYIGAGDIVEVLPQLTEAFGEPFADSSQIPTMLVSKMASEDVTVVLSGDGGDEFFCGYNTYRDAVSGIDIMQSKLGFVAKPLRNSIGNTILNSSMSNNEFMRKAGRCLKANTVEDFYRMVNDDDPRTHQLAKNCAGIETKISNYKDSLLPFGENNLMLMDMLQYLPDDIMTKIDRSAMMYSLETRLPMLDADVMKFTWSLPIEYKLQDGITKKVLRNILYKYVPEELLNRPKKGFSVPISKWLLDSRVREWAESVISDARTKADEYIDTKLVDQIWSDYTSGGEWSPLIWYILVLEQWFKNTL